MERPTTLQAQLFQALALKGMRRGGMRGKPSITPEMRRQEPHANDHQTGRGATAPWFSGRTSRLGRAPGKTGVSAFQTYQRVIEPGKRVRCETIVDGHKVQPHQCSRQSVPDGTRCSQHGGVPLPVKARNGRLVELRPEEMPVLLCDR